MQEQNELTSIIYKNLFGLTRDEFIAQAKLIAGDDWNYIGWNDDDEAARDWLTIEALDALALAESACAAQYRKFSYGVNVATLKQVTAYTMKRFSPVVNIWQGA